MIRGRRLLTVIALSAVLSATAFGAETSSAPATTRAADKAVRPPEDLSTPKQAVITLFWALRLNDGLAGARVTEWSDANDVRRLTLLKPSLSAAWVVPEVNALYQKVFADDKDLKNWLEYCEEANHEAIERAAEELAQIAEDCVVKVDGVNATCAIKKGTSVIRFKKVDGNWKALPDFWGSDWKAGAPEIYESQVLGAELAGKAYEKFKADIKAGNYKSYKDANAALIKTFKQATDDVRKAMQEKYKQKNAATEKAN